MQIYLPIPDQLLRKRELAMNQVREGRLMIPTESPEFTKLKQIHLVASLISTGGRPPKELMLRCAKMKPQSAHLQEMLRRIIVSSRTSSGAAELGITRAPRRRGQGGVDCTNL